MDPRQDPDPPHDCRLTARCFKECFGFRIEPPYDYERFRQENSAIDAFFDRRRDDAKGGEGGEPIGAVRSRPTFSLHLGTMRGATWFERDRPPQGLVWLLGVENHDERHKGRRDAYDIFGRQDQAGVLFPVDVDYKLLDLSRRTRDTIGFETEGRVAAADLLQAVVNDGSASGTIGAIPVRLARMNDDSESILVGVAVSERPITGPLSGLKFPLTKERFLLVAAIVEAVARDLAGDALAEAPSYKFPGGLHGERAFLVAFSRAGAFS